ncbi:hypothetical protein [Aureispira anguillae]|uniref:Lipoprotein n=1 Tax=Aureispira anguillae TaxID=2864201 RepID=A0A916DVR7_9BACT|nr:hypothetical protein [Aureispira anguillae]BDS14676.1 hypothetical protein AsAng_0054570 [Aureispira anguillae]
MKNMSKLLMLFAVVLLAASCDNSNPNTQATTVVDNNTIDLNAHRGAKTEHQAVDRFSLADLDINLDAMETVAMQKMNAEDDDAQTVMNINQALMGAEKEAQLLDVNFSMSDEPVENGMFIFSIESPDVKKLTLEMFDEEGYEMAANNEFGVNEGNNYKALNVNAMDNGDYLFRLKDDQGRELVRTVNIANDK